MKSVSQPLLGEGKKEKITRPEIPKLREWETEDIWKELVEIQHNDYWVRLECLDEDKAPWRSCFQQNDQMGLTTYSKINLW